MNSILYPSWSMKKGTAVKQREMADCGAACLASVAAHYRLRMPVSRVRQLAGTDRHGTTIMGLIEAATDLGFQAKGAKGTIENLDKIPLPAIAHVVLRNGFHHYVVVFSVSRKGIRFMDPADGHLHHKKTSEFAREWTGVVLLLLPADHFKKGNATVTLYRRCSDLIRPHKSMMLQALLGAAIYTGLGLSFSLYLQKIVDFVLVEGNLRLLNLMSVAMILILIFQVAIGLIKSLIAIQTGQKIDARLIMGYYRHLLRLPQPFFDTMRIGELISRVNDAVKIRLFVNDIALNMIVNAFILIFSFSMLFLYYWKLALIMLSIVPLYTAIYWISNRIHRKWQRLLMEQAADLESQMLESIRSALTIKMFGLETWSNDKTETKFVALLRSVYRSSVKGLFLENSADFFTKLFTVIVLWVGSYFVISRELSPGELLSFYAVVGYFTGPAAALISANKMVQDAWIAADRLFEIIDLDIEAVTEDQVDLTRALVGDIVFHDVQFGYGNRRPVLDKLKMTIGRNSMTAIIGESGCGKSTLLYLLQHLYPIKNGKITIGGLNTRMISKSSLRQMIAVVPQQIDLFAGTLSENIAVGESSPDMQKILLLIGMLGMTEFIEQLSEGYNTLVGEKAMNLSGGQRQRIAIARALYRDPEILLLDEASAALDPISEQKVQETLQWFKNKNKTIIMIAHRMSAIRQCDAVLVMKDGKIVEAGSHEELLERGNYYRILLNGQVV